MCVFILTLDIVDFVRIFNAKPTIIEKSNTIDGIVVFTGGEDRIKPQLIFSPMVLQNTCLYLVLIQVQINKYFRANTH